MKTPERYELLEEVIVKLGLTLSSRELKMLLKYVDLILIGSKKLNLTADKTAEKLIIKQIYDSLYPLALNIIKKGEKIVDIGSGGGLPGIPLKICLPQNAFYLIEANRKKTIFLKEAVRELQLNDIHLLHGRAEDWGRSDHHREKYDYAISKAVAEMYKLAELSIPLIRIKGKALFFKGPKGAEEAEKAKLNIDKCGGIIERVEHYKLLTGEKRCIFILSKVAQTPEKYPRQAGKIKNK